MDNSKQSNPEINGGAFTIIRADKNWVVNQRNILILLLAIIGIIVVILSIIFQALIYGIIRGLIFLTTILIVYYKPGFFYNYYIQFYPDGKIIVKKGLLKRELFVTSGEKIPLVKEGKNWLIGSQQMKIPIRMFPNLEREIAEI